MLVSQAPVTHFEVQPSIPALFTTSPILNPPRSRASLPQLNPSLWLLIFFLTPLLLLFLLCVSDPTSLSAVSLFCNPCYSPLSQMGLATSSLLSTFSLLSLSALDSCRWFRQLSHLCHETTFPLIMTRNCVSLHRSPCSHTAKIHRVPYRLSLT